MIFGAHVSVSGGYLAALDYAAEVGCECVQVFAKSPRQWRGSPIDIDAATAFQSARQERGFGPVFTHTAYLINLASVDPEMREKSISALADELHRGAVLGADGVVTHVGADSQREPGQAAVRVASAIEEAFERAERTGGAARLLLENTAGAGSTYGSTFGELSAAIELTGLGPERLGVCFDTCHGFAYGYALDTEQGWRAAIDELAATVGLERLGLLHVNDCKFASGERKDRHEWIGDGFIGQAGFSAMVCLPELRDVPSVTEMPGEAPEKDAVNIARLVALREACPKSQTHQKRPA